MKGLVFLCSMLATTATAHMQMSKPYPIRSPLNKDAKGKKDYSYTNPLQPSGKDYPCKGYAKDDFDSQATYSPGQSYEMELAGSATHDGGSCQISLTYDKGETFHVIESMLGDCPKAKKYKFQVPQDAPSGEALLAWTWFNKVGNREMYMNCAMVTIGGGSDRTDTNSTETINKPSKENHAQGKDREMKPADKKADGFKSLPELFVANVDQKGKCVTIEGEAVNFPEPGPNVIGKADGKGYKCDSNAPFLGSGSSKNASNTDKHMSKIAQSFGTATSESRTQSKEASTNNEFSSYVDGWYCQSGEILCAPDGWTWAMCSNGRPVFMGSVAAGTTCRLGQIVRAYY
ncbi:hypothetical protein NUU61_004583 [Penicillium alfredii]|uniref:Chitin-binding type-4 domain-containing protein n=1 Tax=Penicillium alfredii TaxID=1506179 RepID=A0A9W9KDZ2_9EURO|nr:uncharacterized protein NUU61_004583 [Penicillium alfredii]KAJ5102361.1 hypothetical protein NUU61_004583 [Penicillium alfredii]